MSSTLTAPKPHPKDGWVLLVVVLLLLAWDFSGADLSLTRLFGSAPGFAWRDHFLTATVVHNGGRTVAWLLLFTLVWAAWRAGKQPAQTNTPSSQDRWFWLGITLLCLVAVPAIKQTSATSCPWDLAEFGGTAAYVLHWRWGVPDGGAGRCFPSGHAVAAFAFLTQYFLWRDHNPQRAKRWLWGVLLVGTVFAAAQLARGAHHISHSAWSAVVCLGICVLASAAWRRWVGKAG